MNYGLIYIGIGVLTLFIALVVVFVRDMQDELFTPPAALAITGICVLWPITWFFGLAYFIARLIKKVR